MRSLVLWLLMLGGGVVSNHATDVRRFELLKQRYFYQVTEGVAYIQTNNAYRFSAQVNADVVGHVLGAAVYTPRGSRIGLLADKDGDPYRLRDKFDTPAELEISYPNGNYILRVSTADDGDRSLNFTLTGDAYPAAPIVKNLASLQSLPSGDYIQISWQPFAGGTATDFIQFIVQDSSGNNLWQSHDVGEEGALTGLSTSVLIPPGSLVPGRGYSGTLRFVKVLQGSSPDYPGVPGAAGYMSRTEIPMQMNSDTVTPTVDALQIWRTERSEQTNNTAPALQPYAWEFLAQLDAGSNRVRAVQLTLPSAVVLPTDTNSSLTQFQIDDQTLTNLTDFNVTYPAGAYAFDIRHPDGSTARAVVNFPSSDFPPAPVFVNTDAFPNHSAKEDLVVSWQPWVGATESDFIKVELYDNGSKVWDTSGFTSSKRLPGTATSVTIPASQFIPGDDYRVQIHFYRPTVLDLRTIPGGIIYAGQDSRTRFDFTAEPADVNKFRVSEGKVQWQRSATLFEPDATAPFQFQAFVNPHTNFLNSAQVVTPTGVTRQLQYIAGRDISSDTFQFNATESSEAALRNDYPAGNYTFHFDTVRDGAQTATIALPPGQFPPQPVIHNISTFATKSAVQDFEIDWDPWIGADTNTDTIHFILQDMLGGIIIDSQDNGTVHPLDVSSNVVTILGTGNIPELKANRSYIGRLRFERKVKYDSTAYPGAHGSTVVFTETDFYLSTLDRLKLFTEAAVYLRNTREVQLRLNNSFIGRNYAIYQSPDLRNWSFVKNVVLTTPAVMTVTPTNSAFFKVELLP